jgi:predicted O-linked N-acetylglucosamine transferase (SPINDLY family)
VGASILTNVGLTRSIAKTPAQYVEIAANLARVLVKKRELRMMLREKMSKSPLMNGPKFTANLEQLYRTIWESKQNQ